MMTQIAYILTSFTLQLVVAELMFCAFLPRRSHFPLRLAGCLIPFILLTYDIPFFMLGNISLRFILTSLVSVLIMWFCMDASFQAVLFCCISGYAVRGIGMNLYVLTEFWRGQSYDEKYDPLFYLIFLVLYPICYVVFARRLRARRLVNYSDKRVPLVALAIIVVDQLCSMWYWVYNLPLNPVCPIYGILCCMMILCVQYLLYMEDQLRQDNQLMEQRLRNERDRYALSKNNVDLLTQQQAFLRRTADRLREEAGTDDVTAAALEDMANDQAVPNTGNHAIDIAVTENRAFCMQDGIGFTYMVDGKVLDFMNEEDLYTVLNGILRGAVACERQTQDVDKRFVALKIYAVAGCAYLHVDNYCDQSIAFEDGIPVFPSGAPNAASGEMQGIQYLIQQYDGLLRFSQSGNRLCADILFPGKA